MSVQSPSIRAAFPATITGLFDSLKMSDGTLEYFLIASPEQRRRYLVSGTCRPPPKPHRGVAGVDAAV